MTTMEDLTKTQIVLLTLLVSFITSIATGIITSTLLAQAPQGVTQTIDRVVERTVPSGGSKEVTIVEEGDAIIGAIDSGSRSLVRLRTSEGSGAEGFYSLGVIVSKQGMILSDTRNPGPIGTTFAVYLPDGSVSSANLVKTGFGMALFRLQATDAQLRNLSVMDISKNDAKLGQTVVAINGVDKNTVSVGRAISLGKDTSYVFTDINPTSETQGAPLLNLSGDLVGMKGSNNDMTLPASAYITASALAKFVNE